MGADHFIGSRPYADAQRKITGINMRATDLKLLFMEGLLVRWDFLVYKDTLSWVSDSTRNEIETLPPTGNSQKIALY